MSIHLSNPQALIIKGKNVTVSELQATSIEVTQELSRSGTVNFLEIENDSEIIRVRIEDVKRIEG